MVGSNSEYLVKIDKTSKDIEIVPYKGEPNKKEMASLKNKAQEIVSTLEDIAGDHNVSEDVMFKDFVIGYKNVIVSFYKGINKDGFDTIGLSRVAAGKRVAKHEGAHMGNRRAIEDYLNKNPGEAERLCKLVDSVKGGDMSMLMKATLKIREGISKLKGNKPVYGHDSERILIELYKNKDMAFFEHFANRYAHMNGASVGTVALNLGVGAFASYIPAQYASDILTQTGNVLDNFANVDTNVYLGAGMCMALSVLVLDEGLNTMSSHLKAKKETGILPSYVLNKEIKTGD